MDHIMEIEEIQACSKTSCRQASGYFRSLRFKITLLLVIIVILSFAVLGYQLKKANDRISDLENTPAVVNTISPKIELEVINSDIQKIGELATVEYLFTDAAKYSDSKQIKDWNIPFTEKSFVMKWDGVIKAGVDVSKITVTLQKNNAVLLVKIPAATILSYSVDTNSMELLDESNNVFNKISVSDKVKLDTATETAMKERAIENGLLEKAQASAQAIISNLLNSNPAISGNYTIQFEVFED